MIDSLLGRKIKLKNLNLKKSKNEVWAIIKILP